MNSKSWVPRVAIVVFGFGASVAFAADGPACRTYDAALACCPHPAPSCCAPPVRQALDDASVLTICGAATPKGEAAGIETCKRYYGRGETVGEVSFSRQAGGAAKFENLRASLAGERSRISPATVAGAKSAFVLRELDDSGALERSSAWALVGTEVLSIEAERGVCDDAQVIRLLTRAIERVRGETPPRPAAPDARSAARPPG